MGRRNGFVGLVTDVSRMNAASHRSRAAAARAQSALISKGAAVSRAEAARIRAEAAADRAASERAARVERGAEADRKRAERQAKTSYVEARMAEVADLNLGIAEIEGAILSFLKRSCAKDPALRARDLMSVYQPAVRAPFEPSRRPSLPALSHPGWSEPVIQPLGFFQKLFPSKRLVHEAERRLVVARSKAEHEFSVRRREESDARIRAEIVRLDVEDLERRRLDDARAAAHDAASCVAIERRNQRVEQAFVRLAAFDHDEVVGFYGFLLKTRFLAPLDASSATVGYSTASRHLVVELEMPSMEVIPNIALHRYVKSGDRIDVSPFARIEAEGSL